MKTILNATIMLSKFYPCGDY
uniref:Uncharacterized protein n=1 Tax=Romanomermis culicivorax TaxID=13658 RepID=A0A915HIG9_ROMCU